MSQLSDKLQQLKTFQENAEIRVQTLGQFRLWRNNKKIDSILKDHNYKQKIKTNIEKIKCKDNILILEKGEIENYLPDNFKNLEEALDLIKEKNFKKLIKSVEKTDLENKIKFILEK